AISADHHYRFNRFQRVADGVDDAEQFVADHQYFGAGIVDDVSDLACRQPVVDNRIGRSGEPTGQRCLQARRTVLVQKCDTVTSLHAGISLRGGVAQYPFAPGCPRPTPLTVTDGQGCRLLAGPPVDEFSYWGDCFGHRCLPSVTTNVRATLLPGRREFGSSP